MYFIDYFVVLCCVYVLAQRMLNEMTFDLDIWILDILIRI